MKCFRLILLKNNKGKDMNRLMWLLWLILLTISNISLFSQENNNEDITGIWYTPEKDCKVEMFYKDGKLFGKFVWFEEPNDEKGNPITDTNNPDTSLRRQPLLNKVFLWDLVPAKKEDKWKNGKVYNPRDGRSYKAEISLPCNDTLIVRGYIGISLLGKNSVWTRVPEEFTRKK